MKFQDIKVDWSGFSEKKDLKYYLHFMQILLTYSSLLLPHTPHWTMLNTKSWEKYVPYFIVIFQFFEIFNFENNVLLWKDFGI